MPLHVGIGVITYNRCDLLRQTIALIRAYTVHRHTSLAVADDGSTDGTLEMLHQIRAPYVTGPNAGIAWNKNRALFLLAEVARCDVVILLEDDTQPTRYGWDPPWIAAAARYGHVNIALDHFREQFIYGTGSVADPIGSKQISAQCAAFSREALCYAGYFDSRFKGYGHEHVEHSIRMARCGYGGQHEMVDGESKLIFKLLRGDLAMRDAPSFNSHAESERNLALTNQLVGDQPYRAPWRDDDELARFRGEMQAAQARQPDGFALHPGDALRPVPEGRMPWTGVRLPR
ncbi:MAG: glycosyltransferase [Acetobacteraceae bacterium]|nr:glycosyltransferase [Acetobacteraceae bacterium]